ncbi:hypothetical protein [Streptomyces meridianus]|uniref:Uncharacterized protein n=1 Tax=Streptomyces meridianus TaxID=2938945 RepID=A0ABT0X6N3_9ACTN|nr:hypothetical protein [Streptomyces meridianus]MCM2578182.1 hypothetical protein [Streptomyces meridianus]
MSDAEWERFLRDAVAGVADAPKEPSARARDVAKRLRAEPGPPEGWRTYTPARPRQRRGWYAVGLSASLVLLALALAPEPIVGLFGSGVPDSRPLAAETGRPDQAPPVGPAQRPTLDEPFRGSPAARWASGAAGITVPRAEAVGWMSAAEVERALARSRDFLVASSLDRRVLRGERPDRAIALINPHQGDVRAFLKTAFRAPGEGNDPLMLFSRFQPSRTDLVGDEIKTRGRITYREGERGALQVTADVTFVYPVTRADAGDDEVVRTILRRELVLSWDDPAKVVTEPGTFSIVSYKYHVTNGGCGAPTGYLTPPFGTDRPTDTTGTEIDPYDRSAPVGRRGHAAGDGCETATRS